MDTIEDPSGSPLGVWRIDAIDHRPALPDPAATIELHEGGRAAGSTGMNRFAGEWTFDAGAGTLTFGPLASTLMAGPPERMEQEQRVLQILGHPLTATRDGSALILSGDAGRLDLTRATGADDTETRRRVAGSVTYRERIMPPPGAELTIRVVDVSVADAPAPVLVEETIDLHAVPVAFELYVDPDAIDEQRRYAVRAEISDGERLRWTTDTVFPVLTQDAPETAEMILVAVATDG